MKYTHSQPRRHTPKKSLGQNFLQDANICRKIVGLLDISAQDKVLEIGPGPGALTNIIHAAEPSLLVLLEKDDMLAEERRCSVPIKHARRFIVYNTDALAFYWERFKTPWKIIGNLPYNIASPLMWEVFSRSSGVSKAVFMVQKEVGQRLCAAPNTGQYGALSVWIQSFMRPKMEFIVPPHVFFPQPKVDSAVVSFLPVVPGTYKFAPSALARLLKICFQKRRKQLGSILRQHNIPLNLFVISGIDPVRRPESLSVSEFHTLSEAMFFVNND